MPTTVRRENLDTTTKNVSWCYLPATHRVCVTLTMNLPTTNRKLDRKWTDMRQNLLGNLLLTMGISIQEITEKIMTPVGNTTFS